MTSNNNKVNTDSAEAPIKGVGCGALVRRLRGVEDKQLRDYELETLKKVRASSFRLRWRSTETLCAAYHAWSTAEYCAGWMEPSDHCIRRFVKWAITPPINDDFA